MDNPTWLKPEYWEAEYEAAPIVSACEGYITLQSRLFFSPSLEAFARVRAFIFEDCPIAPAAVCFHEADNKGTALAFETDAMGLMALRPEWMRWQGSPFTALYQESKAPRERGGPAASFGLGAG
jgi:hypothetical protein